MSLSQRGLSGKHRETDGVLGRAGEGVGEGRGPRCGVAPDRGCGRSFQWDQGRCVCRENTGLSERLLVLTVKPRPAGRAA